MNIVCAICELPVNTNAKYGVQRKVEGWEELRKGGGANKIIDRKTTGIWRHSACVGVIPGQETLFG